MATCGKCTATNVTVEHVRACYAMEGVRVAVATRPATPQPRVQVGNVVTIDLEQGYWLVKAHASNGRVHCERVGAEPLACAWPLHQVDKVFADMNAAADHRIAQAEAAEKVRVSKILHGDKGNGQEYRSTYYASPYETRGDATGGTEVVVEASERLHRAHANTQAQSSPWANVDRLRAEVAKHLHYETGQGGSRKRVGHFAIEAEGTLKFLRVKRILSGRYKDRVFVDSMGSDTGYPVKRPDTLEAYLAAILVDPGAAALRYATELGQCSDCGRPLTNEESRARGIGPDCWAKR